MPFATVTRAQGRRVVAAACAQAQARGVAPGMDAATAEALIPGLTLAEAEPQEDLAGLRRLAAWAFRRYTPLVAIHPPDGLVLDITGCTRLFGGEVPLARDLLQALTRHGVAAHGAVADTAAAARALARFGPEPFCIVPPGGGRAVLSRLSVAALELPPAIAAGLEEVGLATIGALIETPRAPLARRFGADLLRRLDEALGEAREVLSATIPQETPRAREDFAAPLFTRETLTAALGKLLKRLCRELEARRAGVRQIDLVFVCEDRKTAVLRIGTARPNGNADALLRLVSARLDSFEMGAAVESIRVLATVTEPLGAKQGDVFDQRSSLGAARAAFVDTALNHPEKVRLYRFTAQESDLPERSVRARPVLELPERTGLRESWPKSQEENWQESWPVTWPRPPHLFSPPEPVTAIALLPDYAPRLFVWRGQRHEVRHADGPERLYGDWWRAERERDELRDYYQVEDAAGRRFWLFRRTRGTEACWFLHGIFQ